MAIKYGSSFVAPDMNSALANMNQVIFIFLNLIHVLGNWFYIQTWGMRNQRFFLGFFFDQNASTAMVLPAISLNPRLITVIAWNLRR